MFIFVPMGQEGVMIRNCWLDWPLVLQGTKVVFDFLGQISWPVAVVLIIYFFRTKVADLLSRIDNVDAFGVKAKLNLPSSISQQGVSVPKEDGIGDNQVQPPLPDPLYTPIDDAVMADLNKHVIGDSETKLAWAVRLRSISEVNRGHETAYRLIFGSQIKALRVLNTLPSAPVDNFKPLFEAYANSAEWREVHKGRTYEDWGTFLVDIGLVAVDESQTPPTVHITPLGHSFLNWLNIARVPDERPA
jgi:hypothetical protein